MEINEAKTDADTPLTNTPGEVPTVFMDGVQGAVVSPATAKLNLVEDYLDPSDNVVKRRFVALLVMPFEQLERVGTMLLAMAQQGPPTGPS